MTGSENSPILQLFVPLHQTDVITVQQPIDLLRGQWHGCIVRMGPAEFLLGQAPVIEHETAVFPAQQFDLVAPAIREGVLTRSVRASSQRALRATDDRAWSSPTISGSAGHGAKSRSLPSYARSAFRCCPRLRHKAQVLHFILEPAGVKLKQSSTG